MMRHKGLLLVALISLAALVFTACAPAAPAPTATPAKAAPSPVATTAPTPAPTPTKPAPTPTPRPPEQVKVHIPDHDVLEMMFVAAIEKGYYKEEGLEVTLEVAPPQVGSKALMAGEFQFSGAGASNVVAALQGAPVKLVMNTAKGLLFWLYAAPGTSFTGLKGKPIGISGLGSIIHVQAKALLAKHGLDPDKDVAFVSAGSASQAMAMLKGGSVAAAVVGIPAVFEAEKAGLRSMAFIGDEIPTSTVGVATTDKLIQEKPELVRRFIRATLKGIRFIMARRGEALPMMQKFMELDQETVEKAYDVPRWRESGIAEASLLAADIEEQRKILNIAEPVPVEKVFNLSFVQAANQDLQAANWKP